MEYLFQFIRTFPIDELRCFTLLVYFFLFFLDLALSLSFKQKKIILYKYQGDYLYDIQKIQYIKNYWNI